MGAGGGGRAGELVFVLVVHLFVGYAHVYLFLFLPVSGVGCDFCLWLFLDFSVYLFSVVLLTTKIIESSNNLVNTSVYTYLLPSKQNMF